MFRVAARLTRRGADSIRSMRRTALVPIFAVALLTLTLAGCAPSRAEPSAPAPSDVPAEVTPTESDRTEVPWEVYAPEVREGIDAATEAADCAALQAEFDTADANSEATMNRTGHNNADLMAYIDEAMRTAGCY